jgi:DNA-binding beta-propeller fold protein YncE
MAWGAVFVFDIKQGRMDVWRDLPDDRRFLQPAGLALGDNGELFMADAEARHIVRLDREGRVLQIFGDGILQRPVGLAIDPLRRRLLVADAHAHAIRVFSLNGELLDEWGSRGGEEETPTSRSGAPLESLTFNFPTFLTYAADKVYVTDTMNSRVLVISAETGRTLRAIGERGVYQGNFARPKGVAVDSEENIYVIEGYFDHVVVFNKHGQLLMAFGGTGAEPGKFNLPGGVWIDHHDRVFVADTNTGRVQVFQFLGGGTENDD